MQNQTWFFKFSKYALLILTVLSFLTPLWVSKELLFPFITSKAFYLRILVEMGLPFFVYILLAEPQSRPNFKNPLHIAVLAFFLVNIISAIVGLDFKKAMWGNFERMGGVFYLLHLILLYFYIVVLSKLQFGFLKALLYSNMIIATALSFYAIFVRLGMKPWILDPSLPRISATFGNPIFFPSYLIPIIFLTAFWSFRKKGFARFVLLSAAFLQLVAVFLSGTRGAVVGLILGGFFAAVGGLIFARNKKLKLVGFSITAIILLAGVALYLNSSKLPHGSMIRRVFELRDNSTTARIIQWQVALRGFKEYPIFGTGAENYYVIGNKYFNPEIYPYDSSWFDKPHNYLLEVLVTSGSVGLAAYLGILIACLFAFYRSARLSAISSVEFSLLMAGLLAYQVQNLFVFDTVSASMSFFIFVSFAAFLWEKILQPESQQDKKPQKNLAPSAWAASGGFAYGTFVLVGAVSVYGVWAGNLSAMAASKNTNYGYAYQSVDASKAEDYFQKALNNPFNFDLSETASKYQDFALNILRNPSKNDPLLSDKVVSNAFNALERVAAQNPHNPITWEKLAMLHLNYGYIKNLEINYRAEQSIAKAIDLAPKRTEAMAMQFQLQLVEGNTKAALETAREMFALNSSPDVLWQLSVAEKENGNLETAVRISEELLEKKYNFPNPYSLVWLIDYYRQQKNWPKAIEATEKLIELSPGDTNPYVLLVEIYSQSGNREKAAELANKLVEVDSKLSERLGPYLNP